MAGRRGRDDNIIRIVNRSWLYESEAIVWRCCRGVESLSISVSGGVAVNVVFRVVVRGRLLMNQMEYIFIKEVVIVVSRHVVVGEIGVSVFSGRRAVG